MASVTVSSITKSFPRKITQIRFQFTLFICVLFILPTATPVNQSNMNYAIVAIGGVLLIVASVWFIWGRSHFTGPVQTLSDILSPEETPKVE